MCLPDKKFTAGKCRAKTLNISRVLSFGRGESNFQHVFMFSTPKLRGRGNFGVIGKTIPTSQIFIVIHSSECDVSNGSPTNQRNIVK